MLASEEWDIKLLSDNGRTQKETVRVRIGLANHFNPARAGLRVPVEWIF
jgi:hypothetical protein